MLKIMQNRIFIFSCNDRYYFDNFKWNLLGDIPNVLVHNPPVWVLIVPDQ